MRHDGVQNVQSAYGHQRLVQALPSGRSEITFAYRRDQAFYLRIHSGRPNHQHRYERLLVICEPWLRTEIITYVRLPSHTTFRLECSLAKAVKAENKQQWLPPYRLYLNLLIL